LRLCHGYIPIPINAGKRLNRIIFLRNFYLSFVVYGAVLFGCIFSSSSATRGICLIAGSVAAFLAGYIVDDFFAITILYLA
jgi:hypothetical protein